MIFFNALFFICVALWSGRSVCENLNATQSQQLPEVHGEKFYYFGYGSNMLAQRIHIQSPTAKRVGPAQLKNYRLDFATIASNRWNGAVATVVPTMGYFTWGTLWEIDVSNLADLDNQEGVHENLYKNVSVQVELYGNEPEFPARVYMLMSQPESNLHDMQKDEVPEDRQPSKTYLQVLVKGASESRIPEDYVKYLKGMKHNSNTVKDLEKLLQVQDVELDA